MRTTVTSDALLVLCSCPDGQTAAELAHELVARKWSACVQIVPSITSVYTWQGKVCQENEALLVIKTASKTISALTKWLVTAHPYDEPEVIAMPITAGSPTYIDWLLQNSGGR